MSNYNGGTAEAKKEFLKHLKTDVDFIEHKKNAHQQFYKKRSNDTEMFVHYGVASVLEDSYVKDAQVTKLIKEYYKL